MCYKLNIFNLNIFNRKNIIIEYIQLELLKCEDVLTYQLSMWILIEQWIELQCIE